MRELLNVTSAYFKILSKFVLYKITKAYEKSDKKKVVIGINEINFHVSCRHATTFNRKINFFVELCEQPLVCRLNRNT